MRLLDVIGGGCVLITLYLTIVGAFIGFLVWMIIKILQWTGVL